MSKTIVIVGNGEPTANVSAAVDAADEVIRFGQTPYRDGGLVGHRTTVLVLRAFALPRPVGRLNFPCVLNVDKVWLLADENYKGRQLLQHEDEDALAARMAKLYEPHIQDCELVRDKHIEFPSNNVRSSLREQFRSKGFANGSSSRTEPSAGMWVTAWVVSLPRYAGWNVKLAGFAMAYPSHPLAYEKEALERLERLGAIERL